MCQSLTKSGTQCRWNGPVCPNHSTISNREYRPDFTQNGGSVFSTLMAPAYAVSNRVWGVASGPRKKETARFREFLDKHKGRKIVGLKEGRQPVNGIVQTAVNALSLGKLKKKAKELNYGDIFHDFIIVELDDGSKWKIEKNHVVENKRAKESDYKWVQDIPLNGKDLDLPEMFANAAKQDPNFWKYRAAKDNCQKFANDVVEKNGLVPEGSLYRQDAQALVDTVVGGETIPNAVTGLASIVDRGIYGDGVQRRKMKGKGSKRSMLHHL